LLFSACSGGGGSSDAGSDGDAAMTSDTGAPDASSPTDAGPTDPRIEIGTGTEAFEALGPGTTVELVNGPQGGYHVQIAFRLWGIDPEGLLIAAHGYDATTGDEITIPAERVLTARRVSVEGDHLLRLGDRLVFTTTDPTTVYDPATSMGTDLRITATFTPAVGDPVTAETTTTVVDLM
jgi:hypothetical protein